MKVDDLTTLRGLAEAQKEGAFLDLKRKRDEEQNLRRELSELSRLRSDAVGWTQHAHMGFDRRWTGYLDQRRATLNASLARILAEQDALRQRAAQMFAQWTALAELEQVAREDVHRSQQSKANASLMDLATLLPNNDS